MQPEAILGLIEAPESLEALYREDRGGFTQALPQALAARPDSLLLRAWTARLRSDAVPLTGPVPAQKTPRHEPWLVAGMALLGGLAFKLPHWFPSIDQAWYYPRLGGMGVVWGILIYLLTVRRPARASLYRILSTAAALSIGLVLMPLDGDAWMLSYGHAWFLFWLVLGAAHAGQALPGRNGWLEYFRFNGEMVIHSGILLLGGAVLTAMTLGLFELLDMSVVWVLDWVVLFGAAAIPAVAAHLALRRGGWRLAPLVARIFAPLFLALGVAYLLTMLFVSNNIFVDREALLVFNILLATVLGLAVFSIVGRVEGEGGRLTDRIAAALLVVTLALDLVALWAILGRLFELGATPNRLAVTGGNLVMLGHILVLVWSYVRLFLGRARARDLEVATVRWLPVYAAWALVVAVVLPLVF